MTHRNPLIDVARLTSRAELTRTRRLPNPAASRWARSRRWPTSPRWSCVDTRAEPKDAAAGFGRRGIRSVCRRCHRRDSIDATRRRLRAAEPSRQPAAHDHGRTVCGIAVQRLSSRWRHSRCHTRLHQSLIVRVPGTRKSGSRCGATRARSVTPIAGGAPCGTERVR